MRLMLAPSKASLKRSGVFQEMMLEIWQCTNVYQIQKLRWIWSLKACHEMWPDDWVQLTNDKLDEAEEYLANLP